MNKNASIIAAVLGLAIVSASAQASVAVEQTKQVSSGLSQDQVIQRLGKPDNAPIWLDGSQSLVYELRNGDKAGSRVYVNLGRNKTVTSVQFGDDGSN